VTDDGTDFLVPFLIDAGAVRGRLVRLGPALESILAPHDYPAPVALLLAQALTLAAALAGSLKFDGVLTLQIQSDGPVSLIVADATSGGDLRGYARHDPVRLSEDAALGKGFLAFTIDQGPETDRYQGIVELAGDGLEACAQRYFQQSEQLETAFRLAARPGEGGWQAAALMIQRMPTGPSSPILTADEAAEAWNRARILLHSARDEEMLDLAPERLLYRLYHADGLRPADLRRLQAGCRCSAERVAMTLKSFPRQELDDLRDADGRVDVVCEFCKAQYLFSEADLDRLYLS